MPVVLTKGHKEGHVARRPRIAGVFFSTQDGPGGPSEVVPHTQDSIRPPFPREESQTRAMPCTGSLSFSKRKTEVCMLLSRMMTTSWSWEPFVLIGGPKEGHIAPHPRITAVF